MDACLSATAAYRRFSLVGLVSTLYHPNSTSSSATKQNYTQKGIQTFKQNLWLGNNTHRQVKSNNLHSRRRYTHYWSHAHTHRWVYSLAVLLLLSRCISSSTMVSRCHLGLSSRSRPGGWVGGSTLRCMHAWLLGMLLYVPFLESLLGSTLL